MAACGTHNHFQAGCPRCQRADRAAYARQQRMIADGTWQAPVPAKQVLAHVTALRAGGMSIAGIARAAVLPTPTLYSAIYEPRKVILGPVAAAILAVEPRPTVPFGHVLPHGTGRRIRALVTNGYSMTDLAGRLGKRTSQIWELAWEKSTYVTVRTHRTVAAMYEQIADIPGPAVRARNIGLRNNWPRPDAWADIDNPDAEPYDTTDGGEFVDAVLVDRALAGDNVTLTRLERHHAVRVGLDRGMSRNLVAGRLRMSKATVYELAGRPLPVGYELVA